MKTLLRILVSVIAAVACGPSFAADVVKPLDVKVLVLNFDPLVDAKTRLHAHCQWQDPRELAKGYAEDVRKASDSFIRYRIVDWQDVDGFPVKVDGFTYTTAEYLTCWKASKGWHEPDTCDYPTTIAAHKIVPRIEAGEIDEVWWFGPPYAGFYESAMAGKDAFYINGGVYGSDKVPCTKAFVVMGFNYERGVAEMLHDLAHRTESTMSRVYGGWKAETLDTDWARFAANVKQSGMAGAGNCHYPPNAKADYDYGNPMPVESTADDWKNYPNLTGQTTRVTCETWGGPDYHRGYMRWWFDHLPRREGRHPRDGRQTNWWRYVFEFNDFDDKGQRK